MLNVTPDSFYDGGSWTAREDAIRHGMELFEQGADVVDVGGESTRPGARPVPEEEERERTVPVVTVLARHGRVSIDTRQASVATAAIAAGATLVNDVSCRLYELAGAAGVDYAAMHMRGEPRTMQHDLRYDDVVAEVYGSVLAVAETARTCGVGTCWVDPGIGFGKNLEHNLALLRHLPDLVGSGWPVLLGVSRKRMIGELTGRDTPAERLSGSLAVAHFAADVGVDMLRVHDVAATREMLAVRAALQPAGGVRTGRGDDRGDAQVAGTVR